MPVADQLQENALTSLPSLERKPGTQNWVDKAGGLPQLIDRVARHLHSEKGYEIGRSIATAVNWAKKMCSTGTAFGGKVKVHGASQAAACKAVAEWEAKKGKSKAKAIVEAVALLEKGGAHLELQEAEAAEYASILEARLTLVEGCRRPLQRPGVNTGMLETAKELLESADGEQVGMQLGGARVPLSATKPFKKALAHERTELRHLIEGMGGKSKAKPEDPTADAEARVEKAKQRSPRSKTAGLTLKRGAAGGRVNQAQERLGHLGYDLTQDGDFGPQTENAVKSFQGDHSLKVDGVLGPNTRVAMRGTTPDEINERRSKAEGKPEVDSGSSPNGQGATPEKAPAKAELTGDAPKDGKPKDESTAEDPTNADGETEDGAVDEGDEETYDWLTKGRGVGGEPDQKVKIAQAALDKMGTYIGDKSADGRFGPDTEKATKRIQRRYGLKPDGMIGPRTGGLLARNAGGDQEIEEALGSNSAQALAAAQASAKGKPKKGKPQEEGQNAGGVTDDEFARLHPRAQSGPTGGQFVKKGSSGPAVKGVQRGLGIHRSGTFEDKTHTAVENFQRENGLQVDGVVGAQTAAALQGSSADPGALQHGDMRKLRQLTAKASSAPAAKGGEGGQGQFSKKAMAAADAAEKAKGKAKKAAKEAKSSSSSSGSSKEASSSTGSTFSSGASGADVKKIQRLLNMDPTGTFDPKTVAAVKKYQRENGLLVDGIVGAQTLSSLLGKSAAEPGPITTALQTALSSYAPQKSKPNPTPKPKPKPSPKPGSSRRASATASSEAAAVKGTAGRKQLQEAAVRSVGRNILDLLEIRRLPNGTFAPKGRGKVLNPHRDVKIPHRSRAGYIRGRVDSGGSKVHLLSGPDQGTTVPLARGNQNHAHTALTSRIEDLGTPDGSDFELGGTEVKRRMPKNYGEAMDYIGDQHTVTPGDGRPEKHFTNAGDAALYARGMQSPGIGPKLGGKDDWKQRNASREKNDARMLDDLHASADKIKTGADAAKVAQAATDISHHFHEHEADRVTGYSSPIPKAHEDRLRDAQLKIDHPDLNAKERRAKHDDLVAADPAQYHGTPEARQAWADMEDTAREENAHMARDDFMASPGTHGAPGSPEFKAAWKQERGQIDRRFAEGKLSQAEAHKLTEQAHEAEAAGMQPGGMASPGWDQAHPGQAWTSQEGLTAQDLQDEATSLRKRLNTGTRMRNIPEMQAGAAPPPMRAQEYHAQQLRLERIEGELKKAGLPTGEGKLNPVGVDEKGNISKGMDSPGSKYPQIPGESRRARGERIIGKKWANKGPVKKTTVATLVEDLKKATPRDAAKGVEGDKLVLPGGTEVSPYRFEGATMRGTLVTLTREDEAMPLSPPAAVPVAVNLVKALESGADKNAVRATTSTLASGGMASPATTRKLVRMSRLADNLQRDGSATMTFGTKVMRGPSGGYTVTHDGKNLTFPGNASSAVGLADRLDQPPKFIGNDLKEAFGTFTNPSAKPRKRRDAAEKLAQLGGGRSEDFEKALGMLSPGTIPSSYTANDSATSLEDLPVGSTFALKGGDRYVIHSDPGGAFLVTKPVDDAGNVVPVDPRTGKKAPTQHRKFAPTSLGPPAPEYQGTVPVDKAADKAAADPMVQTPDPTPSAPASAPTKPAGNEGIYDLLKQSVDAAKSGDLPSQKKKSAPPPTAEPEAKIDSPEAEADTSGGVHTPLEAINKLEPGQTYTAEDGGSVVKAENHYVATPAEDSPKLVNNADDALKAITPPEPPATAWSDPAGQTLKDVADQMGGDVWDSAGVQGALDYLDGQGVYLDPKVESPATIAAVLKAANATPKDPIKKVESEEVTAGADEVQLLPKGGGIKIGNREYHELKASDQIVTASQVGSLNGKSVVLTGKLDAGTRKEITAKLHAAGATVLSGVEKDPDYLVVGQKAGSKLKKARDLGLDIIPDEALKDLIESLDAEELTFLLEANTKLVDASDLGEV